MSGKRLKEEEYKQEAETNLAQAINASSFSLKEKTDFYKKKWLKEHIAIMCLWGVCIIATLIAGIVQRQFLLGSLAILLLALGHGWRNNTMMAYVEKNAYDDLTDSKS